MDQIVRIIKGTPIKITLAKWDDGQQEYRIEPSEPSEPSDRYNKWVEEMQGKYNEEYGDYTYDYDEGIAP